MAEEQGFEPWVEVTSHNGFRDRPVQPLRHSSGEHYSYMIVRHLTSGQRSFYES
jgi:antirestriction protein ArdC